MPKHPEDKVIDAIDRLVDESLKKPKDDYNKPFQESCEHCHGTWHGQRNGVGCPGAFATDEQLASWRNVKAGDARQLVIFGDGTVLFQGVVNMGQVVPDDDGTIHATLTLFPLDEGLLMVPVLPDAPPETFDLDPSFVDLGYIDESSHDDSVTDEGTTMSLRDVRNLQFSFDLENARCQGFFIELDDEDTPES